MVDCSGSSRPLGGSAEGNKRTRKVEKPLMTGVRVIPEIYSRMIARPKVDGFSTSRFDESRRWSDLSTLSHHQKEISALPSPRFQPPPAGKILRTPKPGSIFQPSPAVSLTSPESHSIRDRFNMIRRRKLDHHLTQLEPPEHRLFNRLKSVFESGRAALKEIEDQFSESFDI